MVNLIILTQQHEQQTDINNEISQYYCNHAGTVIQIQNLILGDISVTSEEMRSTCLGVKRNRICFSI